MKLFNMIDPDTAAVRLGAKTSAGIVDLVAAGAPGAKMADVIAHAGLLDEMRQVVDEVNSDPGQYMDCMLEEPKVSWAPVIVAPSKIICVGLNYGRHAAESGLPVPTTPVLFSKFNNSLAAHREKIPIPAATRQADYEVELGVVIGRRARHVTVDKALEHVFGYCTANDFSARDLQTRTSQWLLGKALDKFLPLGPYLVTAEEVPNPQELALRCWVNGELRQNSSTADMIFSVAQIIEFLSASNTLPAGTVILTGTPHGVGMASKPPRWLQPGDTVTIDIERIGQLTNPVVRGS